jgi:hypothetical protein
MNNVSNEFITRQVRLYRPYCQMRVVIVDFFMMKLLWLNNGGYNVSSGDRSNAKIITLRRRTVYSQKTNIRLIMVF